ncbi:MAG: hypothetical protein J6W52_09720 [Bacteroidaceae bacterium]|nr:hypothetical protein [Bacteroidaceae bacterium]
MKRICKERAIWLLLAVTLCACTGNRQDRETIRQAEMLMQEQPDSALHLLHDVNRHSLRGETLARYALIHSIAQDKSGLDVTSDSLLRIAYDYYSRHPEDSLYARSQYYMGKYLMLTAQEDSAYSCLLRARTVSEDNKDYYTAYLATDRMRRITEVSDTALCLALSKEAYQLYIKLGVNNPVNEVYLLRGIGDSFHRCNDRDSTIHYYIIALNKAQLMDDSVAISSVLQNISCYYSHYSQNELALEYALQALSYRGYLDKKLTTLLAQCYTENAEYNKAWQYINALPPGESKESKLVKLSLQHRLNAKIGNADAAQEYFDSACNVAADMYLSTQKDKLELYRKNMHEEMERQRAEFRGKIFTICFAFSVALIILIVWLFVKYHRANEKEKAYKDYLMEQTRNYVKSIVGFQRKLTEKKSDKKHLELDSQDWAEIQAFLEACDNSFVTRFKEKYPTISEKDYQLCLLLRCGFTNPELELVYSSRTQVIKNKQNLLRKKLGIAENNLSLRQYIKGF